MAIETACPTCGKQYKAADDMAGRRVRCRTCGEVFPLGGTPLTAGHPPAAGHHPAGQAARAVPRTGPAGAARGAEENAGDPDAVFANAFSDYHPDVRPNASHNFPHAHLLDRWLPAVLAALSFVWLFAQVFGSNQSGVGWAIPLRLALAGFGFLLVVLPIGWYGMSVGCKYCKFQRPPDPAKRVVAVNLFPYVLMFVIWLMVGSLGGAVPGLVVALVVVAGLAWIVYRPTPEEAPVSLAAAAGAFLVGMIVCGLLAVGVNAAARAIARANKPVPKLVASPVGPGLDWDAPPEVPPGPKHATRTDEGDPEATPVEPTEPGAEQPTTQTAQTQPAATTNPSATPATTRATGGAVASGNPPTPEETDPFDSTIFRRRPDPTMVRPPSDPPPVPTPPEPPPPTPPVVAPAAVAPPAAGDPLVNGIQAAKSPFVAEVRPLGAVRPFARAVFPLTRSPMMLVVRRGEGPGGGEVGEVWDLTRFERVGGGPLPRDEAGMGFDGLAGGNLALSPDGQTIARVTSFPARGVEVLSLGAPQPPAHYPFPVAGVNAVPNAQPSVIGFAINGRILVRWQSGNQVGLQVLDARAKAYLKPLLLPNHVPTAANQAVSADGLLYGVVGDAAEPNDGDVPVRPAAAGRAALVVDVATNAVKRFPIHGVDPAFPPTGAAFAAGGRMCVQFERDGQVIVVTPNVLNAPPIVLQPGKVQVPQTPGGGQAVSCRLVPLAGNGGRTKWLIGGDVLVDDVTRKPEGELGVSESLDARVVNDSLFLIHGPPNARKLLMLKLASSLVPKPQVPAPAPRPNTLPAVRPGAVNGGRG